MFASKSSDDIARGDVANAVWNSEGGDEQGVGVETRGDARKPESSMRAAS
jgi:hypothetical protein